MTLKLIQDEPMLRQWHVIHDISYHKHSIESLNLQFQTTSAIWGRAVDQNAGKVFINLRSSWCIEVEFRNGDLSMVKSIVEKLP